MTIRAYEKARSFADKQEVADGILNLFTNYQGLSIAKALKDSVSIDSPETLLYFSSLHGYFISKGINMTDNDIVCFLESFKNTIDYFFWTIDNVWKHSYKMKTMFTKSHDMPQEILHAYRDSMTEINNIAGFKLPHIPIVESLTDKSVLDFGCGSGFLLKHFIEKHIPISCYTGVDKEEILTPQLFDLNTRLKAAFHVTFVAGDGFDALLCTHDIIWLGEVLHGRPNKEKFLDELIGLLNPGQKIIVSELKENTARSQFFDVKMFLHTGAMEPLTETMDCVYRHTCLRILSSNDISFYHTAITAEVK